MSVVAMVRRREQAINNAAFHMSGPKHAVALHVSKPIPPRVPDSDWDSIYSELMNGTIGIACQTLSPLIFVLILALAIPHCKRVLCMQDEDGRTVKRQSSRKCRGVNK